jgi:hypothetical protein
LFIASIHRIPVSDVLRARQWITMRVIGNSTNKQDAHISKVAAFASHPKPDPRRSVNRRSDIAVTTNPPINPSRVAEIITSSDISLDEIVNKIK